MSMGQPGASVRVVLDWSKINYIAGPAAEVAHWEAATVAARDAADRIHSHASGRLAKDVAAPKPRGPMTADIGSDLPYAGVQNFGGIIESPNLMYIHSPAREASGRFATQEIVAVAYAVHMHAKGYLNWVVPTYISTFIARYRSKL